MMNMTMVLMTISAVSWPAVCVVYSDEVECAPFWKIAIQKAGIASSCHANVFLCIPFFTCWSLK